MSSLSEVESDDSDDDKSSYGYKDLRDSDIGGVEGGHGGNDEL